MTNHQESVLAVIGGGRWGQEILSILGKIPLPFDRVVVVSLFNKNEIQCQLDKLKHTIPTTFSLVNSIENLLAQHPIKAAIIVNSARQHFDTALHLINHGIHVLIEKPIVLSVKHMRILIEKAAQKNVCILPGLSYRFCSYIDNFTKKLAEHGPPHHFFMTWHDKVNELRYGKLKKHDTSIDIAQDVMPHIWTILSKIFQHPTIDFHACLDHQMTDDHMTMQVSLKNITGQISLKRHTLVRQRSILVEFGKNKKNKYLKIDFSNEPGMIFSDTETVSADLFWGERLSPLTQQLHHFFSYIETNHSTNEETEVCLNSVNCSEFASFLLRKHKK